MTSEWQDISTAPKDGTVIDLWRGGERLPDCYYRNGWTYNKGWPVTYVVLTSPPSHWMPRPSAPALSASDKTGE